MLLVAFLPSIGNAQDPPTGPIQASFTDELGFLFSDSKVPDAPVHTFTVDVPRGGIAGVHILMNGLRADQNLSFSVRSSGLVGLSPVWYRLVDVPVTQNTGLAQRLGTDNPHVIRKAPFRVFDALEPIRSPLQIKNPIAVLRFELAAGPKERPGKREYMITLKQGDHKQVLKFTVNVHKVTLPAVGKNSFSYTNWFNLSNMAVDFKLTPWSSQHWAMIEKYAQMMARGRQNTFLLPLKNYLDKNDDGRYVLNRQRLRRLVKIFTDAGMYYIEGGHLASRTGGEWASKTFSITEVGGKSPLATSREGDRALADICGQLIDEIRANNWQGRWLQHATDEPIESHAADYRILAGMIRKYMPGIPIIDANMEATMASIQLYGAQDIWCPKPNSYEKYRDAYEEMKALGDQVWFYTCLDPRGAYLNRLLDQERMRPMLIGWLAALYDLDGFLHWGLNHYRFGPGDEKPIDPFTKTIKGNLPPGDTHVIYPGKGAPWSSTRLEAHRIGFEDYELLKMLRAKDPYAAKQIINGVIRSCSDYIKEPQAYRTFRRQLLTALEK